MIREWPVCSSGGGCSQAGSKSGRIQKPEAHNSSHPSRETIGIGRLSIQLFSAERKQFSLLLWVPSMWLVFVAWKSTEAKSGANSDLYATGIWVWPCDLVLRSGKFLSMASSLLRFSPTCLAQFSREKVDFAVKGTFRLAFQMLGNFGPDWQLPIKLTGVRSHACLLFG